MYVDIIRLGYHAWYTELCIHDHGPGGVKTGLC